MRVKALPRPDRRHSSAGPSAERRREPRCPASGQVRLRPAGLLMDSFAGELVDSSRHGFRARHDRLTLASGQLVDFQFASRSGRACAVWTRIAGGRAETGFRILS